MLLNCLLLVFIHLKLELELLTQFPALNDEKYLLLLEILISSIALLNELSIYKKNYFIKFSDILIYLKYACNRIWVQQDKGYYLFKSV